MATERLRRRIEHLLDEAEEAISRHDWEVVQGHAESVLALDPDNPDGIALIEAAGRAVRPADGSTATPTNSPTGRPPVAEPTAFANDRYQVQKFLGEGGKKKVYLAQDTLLDREVAFALIKTEGLDETSRTRIQREAQAMGRLGSHPHIVTVFDLGEEQGQPYMVTELMGGGDVEGVIEDADDHRLPLEQAISIAVETCRGEPGIGKTRTAQELAAYGESRGVKVLWGRCYEGEGAPPYWSWIQLIRSYIRQTDAEQLRSEMGPGAAGIAELISEVQDKLPDLGPLPELEPEQARFRLFDSVTTFFGNASNSRIGVDA